MSKLKSPLFFNVFILFFLSSCVSTQAYWEQKKYKPEKQGVIYYNPKPSLFDSSALDQRKQDAQMKMNQFCDPEKPSIVSERMAEEVIGQHTNYSSSHQAPVSTFFSRESSKKGGSYEKEKVYYSSPWSHSSGSSTSTNLVRNRVYITFQCD